jgi:hypothetical protein
MFEQNGEHCSFLSYLLIVASNNNLTTGAGNTFEQNSEHCSFLPLICSIQQQFLGMVIQMSVNAVPVVFEGGATRRALKSIFSLR